MPIKLAFFRIGKTKGRTYIQTVDNYESFRGYYCPAVVGTNAIYLNRENIRLYKEKNIRLSGLHLGRQPKFVHAFEKRLAIKDSKKRKVVETVFGVSKRRYRLNLTVAKLQETIETTIALQYLVMNLERQLRFFLSFFEESITRS